MPGLAKARAYLATRRWPRRVLFLAAMIGAAELAFLAVSWYLYRPIDRELKRLGKPSAHAVQILCVGDSHTYGVDADPDMSYPAQLQRLLPSRHQDRDFVVVNQGVPGFNSSQALERLRSILTLDDARPDIVLVCVGKNNDHNFQDARFWGDDPIKNAPIEAQARRILEHSHLFRLGEITMINLRQGLSGAQDLQYDSLVNREDFPFLIDWLVSDYREMIELGRAHGHRTAFLTYYASMNFVDDALEKIHAEDNATVLDVRFDITPLTPFSALMGPTAHPNNRGYAIIARNAADGLDALGWIDAPTPAPAP